MKKYVFINHVEHNLTCTRDESMGGVRPPWPPPPVNTPLYEATFD